MTHHWGDRTTAYVGTKEITSTATTNYDFCSRLPAGFGRWASWGGDKVVNRREPSAVRTDMFSVSVNYLIQSSDTVEEDLA